MVHQPDLCVVWAAGATGACSLGACDPANITQQVVNAINATLTLGPTGPTGPPGTSVGTNGTFVIGANSTVNAYNGSVVYVNDGAQLVDNRTTNSTFNLLGAKQMHPIHSAGQGPRCLCQHHVAGRGCDLRCDNDTDYRALFITRNMVVPGNAPYNGTSGSGSFVECGASYINRDPTLARCVLHATSFCCNTTLNSTTLTS
ncbi:hypothetical protein COO60DRAFT_1547425 [Scenedesmus sp. NREL 46B-D3]|nr:hypothetical protein COO60DRAFT_1547425 [Scenedesmus sp. NREL 46B-D3]